MKPICCFLLGLLLVTSSLSAQPDLSEVPDQFLYRLTANETEAMLLNKGRFFRSYQPTAKIDSLRSGASIDSLLLLLPPGQYLLRTIEKQRQIWSYHSNSQHQPSFLSTRKGSWLFLAHSSALQVLHNGHLIPYDSNEGGYFLPLVARKHLLRIQLPGDTLSLRLHHYRLRKRKRYIRYQRSAEPSFHNKPPRWSGYVLASQPQYRPGDTLRFKALLLNRRAKGHHKPVSIFLRGRKHTQAHSLGELLPIRPGVYVYEAPMSDSLILDQSYSIEIRPLSKRGPGLIGSFYLEDYELKEAQFEVELEQKMILWGDSVRLSFSATEANGQGMREAWVMVQMELKSFGRTEVDSLRVLCQAVDQRVNLDENGKGAFSISSKSLARLESDYELTAELHGELTETQRKEMALSISLPSEQATPAPAPQTSTPQVSSYREGKEVQLLFHNPSKLPIRYDLYRGKTLLLGGIVHTSDTLNWEEPSDQVLWLRTSWFLQGEEVTQEQVVLRPENRLHIEIDQPTTVHPGEEVPVRIRVRDENGQAVVGAELSLVSLNEQFASHNIPDVPVLSNPRHFFKIDQALSLHPFPSQSSRLLQRSDILSLSLHRWFWYQFRFPEGLFQHTQPGIPFEAEVAPFLFDEGNQEKVWMVWIDDRLVYVAGSGSEVPYSFRCQPGYRTIRLRTLYAEYEMKAVHLPRGMHTTLSVDVERLPHQVQKVSRPPFLSQVEATQLNASMIKLATDQLFPLWLRQGNRIHFFPAYSYRIQSRSSWIGPFFPHSPVEAVWQEGNQLRSSLWPILGHHHYRMEHSALIIQADDSFQAGDPFPQGFSDQSFGQTAFRSKDIFPPTEPVLVLPEASSLQPSQQLPSLTIRRTHSFPQYLALEKISEPNQLYMLAGKTNQIQNLEPGRYHFTEIWSDSRFVIRPPVDIQEGEILIQRWDSLTPEPAYAWQQRLKNPQRISSTGPVFNQLYAFGTGAIKGTVSDSLGVPLSDAWLVLLSGEQQIRAMQSDSLGRFAFSQLPPASYQIRYWKEWYEANEHTLEVKEAAADSVSLSLAPLQLSPISLDSLPEKSRHFTEYGDIRGARNRGTATYIDGVKVRETGILPQSAVSSIERRTYTGMGNLTGFVSDRDNAALGFTTIVLFQGDLVKYGTQTDEDGKFSLQVASGVYRVEARYLGSSTTISSVSVPVGQVRWVFLQFQKDVTTTLESVNIFEERPVESSALSGYTVTNLATRNIFSLDARNSFSPFEEQNGARGRIMNRRNQAALWWSNPLDEVYASSLPTFLLRSRFADVAAWEPDVRTDEQGEAMITIHFPDNPTTWTTHVLATTEHRQSGYAQAQTQAQQLLLTRLEIPRFAIAGDQLRLNGRVLNYSEDSLPIHTKWTVAGELLTETDTLLGPSLLEQPSWKVPASQDSLALRYTARLSNGAGDGEEKSLNVLRAGLERKRGQSWYLEGDTSLRFFLDPAKGPVYLWAATSGVQWALNRLESLQSYPHSCYEQTASKMRALSMERLIREKIGEKFSKQGLLSRMMRRLEKGQNQDGGWGWWPGNASDPWMTGYVMASLQQVGGSEVAIGRAAQWLFRQADRLTETEQLYSSWQLLESGIALPPSWPIPLTHHPNSAYEQLIQLRIRQLQGEELDLESLLAQIKTGKSSGWSRYGGEQGELVLRYLLQKTQSPNSAEAVELRRQMIQTPRRNTIEQAEVLATILPDLLAQSGSQTWTTQAALIDPQGQRISLAEFPRRDTLLLDQAGTWTFEKQGSQPLFIHFFQTYWETEPEIQDSSVILQTQFWQAGKQVHLLKAGQACEMRVQIEVKERGDHLMLSVPIPAACSWEQKPRQAAAVYEEYFRDRVQVYWREMKVGSYTLVFPLMPRFSGNFRLNPACVEPMYQPERQSNNALRIIKIEAQ